MPNQQLLDYIDFKSKQGTSNEDIKKLLLESGWKGEDIDAGFNYLNNQNKNSTEFVRKSNGSSKIFIFIISLLLVSGVSFAAYKYVYIQTKQKDKNQIQNITQDNSGYNSSNLINCFASTNSFSFNIMQGSTKTNDTANITTKINYLKNNTCNLDINYLISSSGKSLNTDFKCDLSLEDRKKLSDFFDTFRNSTQNPQQDIIRSFVNQGYCSLSNSDLSNTNSGTTTNSTSTSVNNKTSKLSKAPHITSLSDNDIEKGDALTLSIYGSNFIYNDMTNVLLDGVIQDRSRMIGVTPNEITFLVPTNISSGSHKIYVSINGIESNKVKLDFMISDPNYNVQKSIKIIYPIGGEKLRFNTPITFKWKSTGYSSGKVSLYLMQPDSTGIICTIGSADISSGSLTKKLISGTVCNDGVSILSPGNYKLDVAITGMPGTDVQSDDYFSIN